MAWAGGRGQDVSARLRARLWRASPVRHDQKLGKAVSSRGRSGGPTPEMVPKCLQQPFWAMRRNGAGKKPPPGSSGTPKKDAVAAWGRDKATVDHAMAGQVRLEQVKCDIRFRNGLLVRLWRKGTVCVCYRNL